MSISSPIVEFQGEGMSTAPPAHFGLERDFIQTGLGGIRLLTYVDYSTFNLQLVFDGFTVAFVQMTENLSSDAVVH